MKKISLLLLLLPVKIFCQTQMLEKNAEGKYEYTGVITVDSASSERLYSNAKLFIADQLKPGKNFPQTDDYSKTITTEGVKKEYQFKVTIQCKDGKYKYVVTDFQYLNPPDNINLENEPILKHYLNAVSYNGLFSTVELDMIIFVSRLKKKMADKQQDF